MPNEDPDRPARSPLHIDGDYVGGHKVVNQTAGGDIVGGNKITITYGGNPADAANLAEAFARIEKLIAARPEDKTVDKTEIKDAVERIGAEAQKGETASQPKLERWLLNLGGMAEDIFEVTVASLTNPALGVATVIRKIAEKAKAEQAAKRAAGGGA